MCFENVLIKSPKEIICHACALMTFWAGLSKGASRFDSRGCLLARVASVKLDAFDSDQDDEGSDVAKED